MMRLCPYCGHALPEVLTDGISACQKCSRVFSSTPENVLISAAWMAKKYPGSIDRLKAECGLDQSQAELVYELMTDEGCSIEEFRKIVAPDKNT